MKILEKCLSMSLLLTTVWLAGCDQPQVTAPPFDVAIPAARKGPPADVPRGPNRPAPDPVVLEAMADAWQAELYLFDMYTSVLLDFPDDKPFDRIVEAEGRHVRALQKHYDKYDVTPPIPNTNVFEPFSTLAEACDAAILAENDVVGMYDAFLSSTVLPENLLSLFETLRDVSQLNHVAAFDRCN